MQMNVEDMLKIINVLAENIVEVRYQSDARSYWVNKAPNGGYCGHVLLCINHLIESAFIMEVLKKMGVAGAKLVYMDNDKKGAIKFKVGPRDGDIVALLDAAMEKRKLRRDSAELENMNLKVDDLIKDVRNMRPGIFHKGFNAVKSMTDVLDKARTRYEKQR